MCINCLRFPLFRIVCRFLPPWLAAAAAASCCLRTQSVYSFRRLFNPISISCASSCLLDICLCSSSISLFTISNLSLRLCRLFLYRSHTLKLGVTGRGLLFTVTLDFLVPLEPLEPLDPLEPLEPLEPLYPLLPLLFSCRYITAGNGTGPATAAPSLRRFNIDGKNLEANDDDDRILLYIIYNIKNICEI
jgi:hypothetical protein